MSLLTMISWNMHHQPSNWETVLSSGADAALLQEAKSPPPMLANKVAMDIDDDHLAMKLPWRAAVVGLSNRIEFTPFRLTLLEETTEMP